LLDASRFDGRNHNLVRVQQDLRPLVDSVRGEMKALAQHKRQTLNLHWLDGPVWAGVDAFRFQQVIRNVLANALRFAPNDSAITIDAKDEGDQTWRIRISDQGPGIPDGELESIFLPFVQSSRTRDGAGGTGLGLHFSSKIMQAHDGAIHAGNNAQGGAVMTLCLPKGAPTPGTQARHLAPVLRPPATPAVLATPH
jgi:signal transduction histidine kinase